MEVLGLESDIKRMLFNIVRDVVVEWYVLLLNKIVNIVLFFLILMESVIMEKL